MDSLQIESEIHNGSPQRCDYLLLTMAFINFVVQTAFSYILPFFPVLAFEHAGLDYTLIGILMSINSIGSTVSAYVFGTRIQQLGRKKFFLISLFAQSLVMILYASLYFMTGNFWLFFCVSVFTRMFEGVVRSIYAVASFTYLNILWKQKSGFAKRFSTMETASSIGQVFGLVFGSLVNYLFGYWVPLLGIAFLFLVCLLLAYIQIPNDDTLEQTTQTVKAKLPINVALTQKSTFITFISLVITRATLNYYISFFSHHMLSYKQNQNYAALIISLPQIACIIAMPIIPRLLTGDTHFEFLQSLSVVFSFVGVAIISPVWSNGNDFAHIWIGLIVMGLGSALNRIPAIPVLTLSLKKIDLPSMEKSGLSDMASALYQMNLSISNLIFPLVGGGLYDLYGGKSVDFQKENRAFRFTMLSLLVVQVIQFGIDILINGGLQIWQSTFSSYSNNGPNKFLKKNSENSDNYNTGDNSIQFVAVEKVINFKK